MQDAAEAVMAVSFFATVAYTVRTNRPARPADGRSLRIDVCAEVRP
jgi:hypothetical protein